MTGQHIGKVTDEEKLCERCWQPTNRLYTISTQNEDDNDEVMNICWDCDWEIMNGQGELEDDSGVIMANRRENNYEYDPINEVRPY